MDEKGGEGEAGGATHKSPPRLQLRADFMLCDRQSGQSEAGLQAENVCLHIVRVCLTLSVGEELEVLGCATQSCQMFLCGVEEGLAEDNTGQ